MSLNLPIIDITALATDDITQWGEVIDAIDKACRDIGFFYVTGHGIPAEQFKQVEQMAKTFFALPEEQKKKIDIQQSPNHRGWGAMSAEKLDPNGLNDYKETFDMALDLSPYHPQVARCKHLYGPNQYPNIEGFIQLMQQQYQLNMEVALRILKAMALALKLPIDFFSQHFSYPVSVLRLIHYPPQQQSQNGAGEHTDYGCITLLYQDQIGGLQVKDRHGNWLEATPVENSFVVNIGDLMQRWTNDCYKSTPHRVSSPTANVTRFSMPFFVEPNFDTQVSTIPSCIQDPESAGYEQVTAGDWILSRFADTYEYRSELSH